MKQRHWYEFTTHEVHDTEPFNRSRTIIVDTHYRDMELLLESTVQTMEWLLRTQPLSSPVRVRLARHVVEWRGETPHETVGSPNGVQEEDNGYLCADCRNQPCRCATPDPGAAP